MTLRQWYAGQALAGLIAGEAGRPTKSTIYAEWAFGVADAMLAHESAEPKP
jgi:hypothetical protein